MTNLNAMIPQRTITAILFWDSDRPLWTNIGMVIGSICPIISAIVLYKTDYNPSAFLCLIPTVLFAFSMGLWSVIDSIKEGLEQQKKTGHAIFVVLSALTGILEGLWVSAMFFIKMLYPLCGLVILWSTWKYGISQWFAK